jgi:hypothetical protein
MTIKTLSAYLLPEYLDKGFSIKEMPDGRIVLCLHDVIQWQCEGYISSERFNAKCQELLNAG